MKIELKLTEDNRRTTTKIGYRKSKGKAILKVPRIKCKK